MKIKDKTTQKREIKTALEKNGWEIKKLKTSEWWENEVWKIESLWSPVGKSLFLIFENDPSDFADKIIEPWALSALEKRPIKLNEVISLCSLTLNNKWKNNLPDFISDLADLRHK